MKVFIRTSELGKERPAVFASYRDDTIIADDAHGEGMTVMTLPDGVLAGPARDSLGLPSLAAGWRERAGNLPVKAEARRRIEDVFSLSDQLNELHALVDTMIRHGTDIAKWPADARQRKNAYDERLRYVNQVKEKAKAHSAVMPRDPASDKAWPQRPRK